MHAGDRKSSVYLDILNAQVYQGDHAVFHDLTMRLYRGQHTCLLGPNGAGKTTLLKLLTRELYPVAKADSHVRINGSEQVDIWHLRRQIGLVSHELQSRYDAHVRARDVVLSGFFGAIGMHGHLSPTQDQQDRVDAELARMNLQALQNRRYWHLSTGQQRKFLLARALIHRPDILILDEPSNGLDLKSAYELLAQLRHLARSGVTLLLATHHIQELLPEITRIIMLKGGKVVYDGNKTEAITDAQLSCLYDTPLGVVQQNGFFQVFPQQGGSGNL